MRLTKGTVLGYTAAAVIFLLAGGQLPAEARRGHTGRSDRPAPVVTADRSGPTTVHIYFGSPGGAYLVSETRTISDAEDAVQLARAILEALIRGPRSDLLRTLPASTRLRALFIAPGNICTVDFSPDLKKGHPGGCRGEMLTVYSIVNSLIVNVPSIKRVKLLIDGEDVESILGHLSLKHPIPANMLIIR